LSDKKDTTGNQRFDTLYHFTNGNLASSTRDTNDNGRINIWTLYENNLPVEQKQDENEDNIMDSLLIFDTEGELKQSFKDPHAEGKFRITGFYEKGELKQQHQDTNEDGKPDYYAAYDEAGLFLTIREDTQKKGYIDRVRHYRAGRLFKVETDTDGNQIFETVSLIKKDKVFKNIIDKNQDGRPDAEVFFDENSDGLVECVEHYTQTGTLERLEEKNQGITILTWFYDEQELLVRGEEDRNRDGMVEIRYLYEKGILKCVQEDNNKDGKPDLWEESDETQAVVKREKDLDFDGIPDFVDAKEQVAAGS